MHNISEHYPGAQKPTANKSCFYGVIFSNRSLLNGKWWSLISLNSFEIFSFSVSVDIKLSSGLWITSLHDSLWFVARKKKVQILWFITWSAVLFCRGSEGENFFSEVPWTGSDLSVFDKRLNDLIKRQTCPKRRYMLKSSIYLCWFWKRLLFSFDGR